MKYAFLEFTAFEVKLRFLFMWPDFSFLHTSFPKLLMFLWYSFSARKMAFNCADPLWEEKESKFCGKQQ